VSNGRNDHCTATADSAVRPYGSTDAEQIQKANQSKLARRQTQPSAAQDFWPRKGTASVHEFVWVCSLDDEQYVSSFSKCHASLQL
jgi:hypothetical protein